MEWWSKGLGNRDTPILQLQLFVPGDFNEPI